MVEDDGFTGKTFKYIVLHLIFYKVWPSQFYSVMTFLRIQHLLTESHVHFHQVHTYVCTIKWCLYVVCRMSYAVCCLFSIFYFRIPISELCFLDRVCSVLCAVYFVSSSHVFLQSYCQPLHARVSDDDYRNMHCALCTCIVAVQYYCCKWMKLLTFFT